MAKNSTAKKSDAKRKDEAQQEDTPERRIFLYPLEPTSIDPRRIDAAIDAVNARRKSK